MEKSVINIEKDELTAKTEKTEISHDKEKISVSAPSIIIRESDR